MQSASGLYRSSVGKKVVMATSGLVLFAFVVGHMIGNLKVYQGPERFDAYARYLREVGSPLLGHGELLWIVRAVLLLCVALHVVAAVQLTLRCRAARHGRYARREDLSFSYASHTMRWGGVLLVAFVAYHLLHLTAGTLHPDFGDSPYHNVVAAFRVWWVAAAYAGAVGVLGLHVYHGLWSATQTLGLGDPRLTRWRRPAAGVLATAIVAGYLLVPFGVLAGLVR
ncbi:MAG TPA: succinate dehydrogenase cytochrome b subunit [Candidatus Polarisedimenticolaceae bacterium]|nr:succinate dehydrogenase cytochrome b subunit [Candidatus Polarisedimenticolaceae bacterium]